MDNSEQEALADALRKTMSKTTGAELDTALLELGWHEMLTEFPDIAVPLVFRLLGETGAHASVLNDVVLHASGAALDPAAVVPLPYAGGSWVQWERTDHATADRANPTVDGELPVHRVAEGDSVPLAAARRALAWWLVGTARTMLDLARTHALDRVQFGKPVASFQAVRHKLAETFVALEGAEATLIATDPSDEFAALLGKAAAGKAALLAAKHCQQTLGGIGFTDEHDLHRHIRRALVLDGLFGSTRELTREAGATIRSAGSAPRLVDL